MLESLNSFSKILSYPTNEFVEDLDCFILEVNDPEIKEILESFKTNISGFKLEFLRELYTRTFDLKSMTCLDVGYVLFGEDYKRGAFLVELKRLAKQYEVDCGSELPDNLPNFLRLIDKIEDEKEQTELIEKICLPALLKISQDFERLQNSKNVFEYPIKGLIKNLEKKYKANEIVLQGAPVC